MVAFVLVLVLVFVIALALSLIGRWTGKQRGWQMHIRIMRWASLKQRVFTLIAILCVLPVICFALTAYSMIGAQQAQGR
jgi:hypothetical protein